MTIEELKEMGKEADIPIRELGARSGVVYSRVCDAFNGWVKLRPEELEMLELALMVIVAERAIKYDHLLGKLRNGNIPIAELSKAYINSLSGS